MNVESGSDRLRLWVRPIFSRRHHSLTNPRVPAGLRIYAIGDVHGRADLLGAMASLIKSDLRVSSVQRSVVVLLGDYIDRGSESKTILEQLAAGSFGTHTVALRGNHEAMLLSFLAHPSSSTVWLTSGGLETLRSYEVFPCVRHTRAEDLATALRERMPDAHLRFLKSLPLSFTAGDYFFCHAGVRPGVPLGQQSERDLLWIRDEFLRFEGAFEKVIVHGHTPVPEPEILPSRLNIDTGAYATGRLTCVVLEHGERRILTAAIGV